MAAYAGIKWNYSHVGAGNANLSGAQSIQVDKAAAGWIDAIADFEDLVLYHATNEYYKGSEEVIGSIDIKTKVELGTATTFRYYQAKGVNATISLVGVQPVLVIIFQ